MQGNGSAHVAIGVRDSWSKSVNEYPSLYPKPAISPMWETDGPPIYWSCMSLCATSSPQTISSEETCWWVAGQGRCHSKPPASQEGIKCSLVRNPETSYIDWRDRLFILPLAGHSHRPGITVPLKDCVYLTEKSCFLYFYHFKKEADWVFVPLLDSIWKTIIITCLE